MSTTPDYDALAAWAESELPAVRPDAVIHRGDAALAASRALLDDAAESDTERESVERGTDGRLGLDPKSAPGKNSSTWNVSAPESLDTAARARAATEGKDFSTFVRDVINDYLAAS